MARILSISGLRGTLGDRPGLDPEYVTRFAMAIGTLAQRHHATTGSQGERPKVVVARDGRPSGVMVRHAVTAGLLATGCDVIDADIAMTPTCGVLVQHLGATMGLQITASHNPAEWNGLKPFNAGGSVLNAEEGQPLLELLESGDFHLARHDALGHFQPLSEGRTEGPAAAHFERVESLVDVAAIKRLAPKVVVDCCRGAGGMHTPQFLRDRLGCRTTVLGGQPDGQFEHTPEPTRENLAGLVDRLAEAGAAVGFAQDPDADRLAIVCPELGYIGEELTLALAADHVLASRKGPLVVNGSTSRVCADIAAKHGCDFHRSHVGEANVTAMMKQVEAVLGGEGNGGVIEPRVGYVRDSLVSMAYVLDGLAARGTTLADWVRSLPRYEIVKDKVTCPRERVDAVVAALQSTYPDADATTGDGLRLDWPDRWLQVRASNTEPIVRVIAEAPSAEDARALVDAGLGVINAA